MKQETVRRCCSVKGIKASRIPAYEATVKREERIIQETGEMSPPLQDQTIANNVEQSEDGTLTFSTHFSSRKLSIISLSIFVKSFSELYKVPKIVWTPWTSMISMASE